MFEMLMWGTGMQAAARRDMRLERVDFKRPMAGVDWWVDVSHRQRDVAYAEVCLQRALDSGSERRRQRNVELQALAACHAAG